MHIYSSPRNMSVNLGSVSTKHEHHLLPNRLYPQQIWHCAHSFCFRFLPLEIFLASSSSYLFSFFVVFIVDNSIKHGATFTSHSHYLGEFSFFPQTHTRTPLNEVHMFQCVCMCDGSLASFGSHRSVQTHCDQLQGCTSIPLGCGYKPFAGSRTYVFCVRE